MWREKTLRFFMKKRTTFIVNSSQERKKVRALTCFFLCCFCFVLLLRQPDLLPLTSEGTRPHSIHLPFYFLKREAKDVKDKKLLLLYSYKKINTYIWRKFSSLDRSSPSKVGKYRSYSTGFCWVVQHYFVTKHWDTFLFWSTLLFMNTFQSSWYLVKGTGWPKSCGGLCIIL